MPKLMRKNAPIFGSSAGLNDIGVFGSLQAGAQAFSTDPNVIQGLDNWAGAWKLAVIGGNSPAIEDMNGFCFVSSYQLAYILQSGVAEWNASTVYYIGNLVNVAAVVFTTSVANANAGAVYTNNSQDFRVLAPIVAGTRLICSSTGLSSASGTLTKSSGTGDATITFSAVSAPFAQVYVSVTDGNTNHVVTDATNWTGYIPLPGKPFQKLAMDANGHRPEYTYASMNEQTLSSSVDVPANFNLMTGCVKVPNGVNVVVNGSVNCAQYLQTIGTGSIQVAPTGSFRVF